MPRHSGYSYERNHTSPSRAAFVSKRSADMQMPSFNVAAGAGGALVGWTFARPQPCWMCIAGGALVAGAGVPLAVPASDSQQRVGMDILVGGAAGAAAQLAGMSREVQMVAVVGGAAVSYYMSAAK